MSWDRNNLEVFKWKTDQNTEQDKHLYTLNCSKNKMKRQIKKWA